MKIIPAIDLKDGKCVRLFQGDFDQQTEYSANPAEIADRFSQLPVSDLHVVDLDGARGGLQKNRGIVEALIQTTHLDVQLGGGIRSRDDVSRWIDIGVSRCVIGSLAMTESERVNRWIEEFGADRIVVALDVRIDDAGEPMLTSHGWTRNTALSLWDCLDRYDTVRHLLCTDVSRDGALSGPSLALYRQILDRYPDIALQASGGVRDSVDLTALRDIGCPAAITGRALLDGRISETEIATFRPGA